MNNFWKALPDNNHTKLSEDQLKTTAESLGILSGKDLLKKASQHNDPPDHHKHLILPKSEKAQILDDAFIEKMITYDREQEDRKFFSKNTKQCKKPKSFPSKGQCSGYNLMKYFESCGWKFGIIEDLPCYYNSENGAWYPINSEAGRRRFMRLLDDNDKSGFEIDMLDKIAEAILSNAKVHNVLAFDNEFYLINFLDGVYDIRDGTVLAHSSEYLFLYCLNAYTYQIKDSYIDGELLMTYLNNSFEGDQTKTDTLGEIIGVSISKIRNQKQAFILYGKTSSGKSVALNVISSLLCEDFVSALSLTQLGGKFEMSELSGSWLNTSSEIPAMKGIKADMFKRITGNDPIHAERKCKTGFKTRIHAMMLFAVNTMPTVPEPDEAYYARLRILEFEHTVPKENWISNIENRLINEELGYILQFAIEGLKRYIDNGMEISGKEESDNTVCEAKVTVNSFSEFANDCLETCSDEFYILNSELFSCYEEYCIKNHMNKECNNICSQYLTLNFNAQRVQVGKNRDRGYKGIRFK
jgi:P4 family phage/plasmid primase-like protien